MSAEWPRNSPIDRPALRGSSGGGSRSGGGLTEPAFWPSEVDDTLYVIALIVVVFVVAVVAWAVSVVAGAVSAILAIIAELVPLVLTPQFLLPAFFVWMGCSNSKATSSTLAKKKPAKKEAKKKPAKKEAKKKPAKKKTKKKPAKKKEDPGPPSLLVAKGKLPSASSVLKRNSKSL